MNINGLRFTEYQISQLSNGCGAKKFTIRPPYHLFFEASCHIHDINYWIGGDKKDRKKADKGFYKYMKSDVSKFYSWYNPKRWYFKAWCWIYYLAVRWFGGFCFNFGEKKTQQDVNLITPKKHFNSQLVDLQSVKRILEANK